ncbi:MAG: fumarylacetoacetate hydrolase family protein [Vulcanimicrobiaceae bacterium]
MTDGEIVDLGLSVSLRQLVQQGETGLNQARDALKGNGTRYRRNDVRLFPPIPDPPTLFCVGKNNKSHLDELKRNDLIKEMPKEPTGFVKLTNAIVGDDAEVERPQGITTLDYEPELSFVLGKRAFRVLKADAMEYVAGITLINDMTAREIQKQEVASGTRFWTSKNMPGFAPLGPFMMTLDEVADPHDLWVTCTVNGKTRMRVNTGDVIFRIGDVIEHFSRWMPLEAGTVIAMGAPAGTAFSQPNADELYLKPGDVVEIAFEGMPGLRTRIVAPKEG